MKRRRSSGVVTALAIAAALGGLATHADPAPRARGHRHHSATREPTTRHGRPIRIPLTSHPSAFAPPTNPAGGTAPARPYDHVLIISLDGMRPDAIDMTDAPNLRRIREQGANATESRTITHSYTLPSHSSMLTGVDTDRHGLTHNSFNPTRPFIRFPTIFYRAHDAGLATAMFVSKPKFRHIAVPGTVDVFARPDYHCERVVGAASQYLTTVGAGITFVHLSEPDEAGHSRGWMTESYLRNVASADRCVGTLMATLSARADRHRFLVIISADHGGHGRTHGSQRDEDMRIPWIAWGANVRRGAFATPVSTMDTAATALVALGLPMPSDIVGRPVRIALDGPAPLARRRAPHRRPP